MSIKSPYPRPRVASRTSSTVDRIAFGFLHLQAGYMLAAGIANSYDFTQWIGGVYMELMVFGLAVFILFAAAVAPKSVRDRGVQLALSVIVTACCFHVFRVIEIARNNDGDLQHWLTGAFIVLIGWRSVAYLWKDRRQMQRPELCEPQLPS